MRTVTFLAAAWLFCGAPLASQPPNDQATGGGRRIRFFLRAQALRHSPAKPNWR
jgi:hypothetical protein